MKTPDLDGLHVVFYQKMWIIISDTLVDKTKNFFCTRRFPKGINDTLITLIPKMENPKTHINFKPINLCNVNYKIITNAMTNILKEVMKEVVGPNQSSFVPACRQITNNIIIYQ